MKHLVQLDARSPFREIYLPPLVQNNKLAHDPDWLKVEQIIGARRRGSHIRFIVQDTPASRPPPIQVSPRNNQQKSALDRLFLKHSRSLSVFEDKEEKQAAVHK